MMDDGGSIVRPMGLAAFVTALLAVSAAPARADGFITPFIGYNFGGDSANCATLTSCEEKHTNFGVSIGTMGSIFGFEEDIAYAKDFFAATPGAEMTVDLAHDTVVAPDGTRHRFTLDPARKRCLLEGLDDIQLTLQHDAAIAAFEQQRFGRLPWLA